MKTSRNNCFCKIQFFQLKNKFPFLKRAQKGYLANFTKKKDKSEISQICFRKNFEDLVQLQSIVNLFSRQIFLLYFGLGNFGGKKLLCKEGYLNFWRTGVEKKDKSCNWRTSGNPNSHQKIPSIGVKLHRA